MAGFVFRRPPDAQQPRVWSAALAGGAGAQTITVNQASEVDTAQSIVATQRQGVAQASELDTAQAIAAIHQAVTVGLASTVETAQPITVIGGEVVEPPAPAPAPGIDPPYRTGAYVPGALRGVREADPALLRKVRIRRENEALVRLIAQLYEGGVFDEQEEEVTA